MRGTVLAGLLGLGLASGVALADAPFASRRVLTGTLQEPARVALADLDGDGDLDLLVAAETGSFVLWFENDGEIGRAHV